MKIYNCCLPDVVVFATVHSTINICDSRFSRKGKTDWVFVDFQLVLIVRLLSCVFHQTLVSYTLLKVSPSEASQSACALGA